MLYILTSIWGLRTPNARQNLNFEHYSCQKALKNGKSKKLAKQSIYQLDNATNGGASGSGSGSGSSTSFGFGGKPNSWCDQYIPFYSEYKSWPQAGFEPPSVLGQLLEFAVHKPTKPPRLDN